MIKLYEPETLPYGKRYWYAHMQPDHVAIWERFIENYKDAYDTVQYDVEVGSEPDFSEDIRANMSEGEIKLYLKKIDVIGFKNGEIDIIEIKPKATASAVGQVKRYKFLYMRDFKPTAEPRCIILTDKVDADDREFARDEGVLFTVV